MKNIFYILLLISATGYGQSIPYKMPFGGVLYSFYETLNQNDKTTSTSISNINLTASSPSGAGGCRAVIGISSSSANTEVYWEVKVVSYTSGAGLGIARLSANLITGIGAGSDSWAWIITPSGPTSLSFHSGTTAAYGTIFHSGDVIGFALNMTAGTLECFLNGVSQGVIFTGITGIVYPCISTYSGNAFTYTCYFDPSTFNYTPPVGYVAIHR